MTKIRTAANAEKNELTRNFTQKELDEFAARTAKDLADYPRIMAASDLASTDSQMIRAIEDLIDTLKLKGVISAADLPGPVVARIAARKTARGKL